MTAQEILDKFEEYGKRASFHYADDSTKEWSLGDRNRNKAMTIFNENKNLQYAMRVIAQSFLWNLKD